MKDYLKNKKKRKELLVPSILLCRYLCFMFRMMIYRRNRQRTGLEFGGGLGCVSLMQKPRILGMEKPRVLNIDGS